VAEKIIGIDLGTSNSAASVVIGGRPTIIPSTEGITLYGKAFPSYVAITKDGELLVGEPARRQAVLNPTGTVTRFKRKMGTDFKYQIWGKEYTPQQLSALLLQKIKKDAEAFLGEPVNKAVVTVPAYFNDNQRQATKDAGVIAGLDVVRIINEPTAAALAYGLDKLDKEMRIMVFDFGGGTLDVTIMEFGQGVFEVKSTSGDTQLGGTDMDRRLVEHILENYKRETGIDLARDASAMSRVLEAAERAKIELSNVAETEINLPYIAHDGTGPRHLYMRLTRSVLEEIVRPIVEKCREPVMKALTDAKLEPKDVEKIILVGGPTRMPIVREFVKEIMGKEPERGIDPMECVSLGAAIQAAILAGEFKDRDIVLLDVVPISLGIETLGGVFTPIIERNTTIPVKRSQIFTTAADFQTSVDIHVLQGERPMAADNVSLGRFTLSGIPPAPRGVPKIDVTYDINADGILTVTAKDTGTGKDVSVKITAPHRLSKEEVERMIKEAEKFAEQDRRKKEEAELRNEADSLLYTAGKALSEFGDKAPAEVKKEVEADMNNLRESMKGADVQAIKQGVERLRKSVQKIGASVYGQAGGEPKDDGGKT